MIISLDTETTGVDFVHGARPFLVTWCEEGQPPYFMEWPVDPLTRQPEVPEDDLAYLTELLDAADLIYLHNAKFDARALAAVGVDLPWPKVRDTLVASHILATNHKHDLTSLCFEYLRVNIAPHELLVKEVVQACRTTARRDFPSWRIADEGLPEMPSVKPSSKRDEDKPWKNDMWLPRALANHLVVNGHSHEAEVDESWMTACSKYACADSEHTLYLGLRLEQLLRERGYWSIYEHRLHLPRIACEMEEYGVTAIGEYTEATIQQYEEYVAEAEAKLVSIASGYDYDLDLAEGAALNDNMRDFFYGAKWYECPRCPYRQRIKHWNGEGSAVENGWMHPPDCPKCGKGTKRRAGVKHQLVLKSADYLNLPVVYSQKTHNATLDAAAMQEYLQTLDGEAHDFIALLADKRGYDTALSYMHAYHRFWLPVPGAPDYFRIHGSLNPCGTHHLRWASNSPNMQNIGVGDDGGELNLRSCFGPAPGREWWDFDFKNLEKRIPAYESQEPKLIEIFERPDEPPYWGSDHNLIASLLFPEEFWPLAEIRDEFKVQHKRKLKKAKNVNFAKQYGAGRKKCAWMSGIDNAYDLIDRGLPELAKLQDHYLTAAKRTGWVQTLPDRTVDPTQGYPILASRTEDGGVLSTTPFNYHVSGTACWAKNTALIRCSAKCAEWRAGGFDAHLILEVHDSLLFDFPRGATPEENLPRALVLKELMEQSGADLIPAIPTPVSVEYVERSWAEGVRVA